MTATIDKLIERSRNGNKPVLLLQTGERVKLTGHDGEAFNVTSLGGKHEGKTARMNDGLLMKAMVGEFEPTKSDGPEMRRVLFEQDRDDWSEDLERKKRNARTSIEKANQVPSWKMPTHPVIVIFDQVSADDPEDARAKLHGPEIHVFDPSDPLTEFLHELSHAYWLDRMSKDERARWDDLARKARKDPPRLPGETDTGEHCFAIAYAHALKAELLDPAYRQILKSLWPDACSAIRDLFESVRRQEETEAMWRVKKSLLMAAVQGTAINEKVTAPERLEKAASANGVDWMRDGGMLVPCRNGLVDFGLLRRARGGMIVRRGNKEVLMKADVSGTLYVDLDGVLVDFIGGAAELGYDLDLIGGDDADDMWKDIADTPNFWSGLDWTADGKRLWSRLKKYNPVVLTSISMSAGKNQAREGKLRWVADNLGKDVKVVIVEDSDKGRHARRGDVLIDDDYNGKILKGWKAAGGTAVKHEDTKSTLKKLDDLGLK